VGVGTTALGLILCVVVLAGAGYWLAKAQPWRNGWRQALADPAGGRQPAGTPGTASAGQARAAQPEPAESRADG
jgi:uncharacterized iron-regulated membrane protein